jgi:hypothetical protein
MTLLLLAVTFLRLDPAVITDCRDGLGRAVLHWTSTDAPTVTLFTQGIALTGPESPTGSNLTGYWVADGQVFSLQAPNRTTLATVTARVNCTNLPLWPLAVGNYWTFRLNTRQQTGLYQTWRVTRQAEFFGETWSLVTAGNTQTWWRIDALGALHRIANNLDETMPLNPVAETTVPAGLFADNQTYFLPGFIHETGTLSRGVGPVRVLRVLTGGSSGGLDEGFELVEAKIGDRLIRRDLYKVNLQIDPEVYNCAIPCYFVACGFAGADLPGTFKPCQEARVEGADLLTITGPDGDIVLREPLAGPTFLRLPLWQWPAGSYSVQAYGREGTAKAVVTRPQP